jgi:hypothetical protein
MVAKILIQKTVALFTFCAVLALPTNALGMSDEQAAQRANKLYKLLNSGLPLLLDNPLRSRIIDAVKFGDDAGAAAIITDPRSGAASFYNLSIASLSQTFGRMGSAVGNRQEIAAFFIGHATTGIKFNEAFWANRVFYDSAIQTEQVRYNPTNPQPHLDEIWLRYSARDALKPAPRPGPNPGVGIFTTNFWQREYFMAGTSRRNWGVGILENLYCVEQDKTRTLKLPDTYVGRDVPRVVAGDAMQFQRNCKSCHAQMDGVRTAFLAQDFTVDPVATFREKINEEGNNIELNLRPPTDDSWNLFFTSEQNAIFGFQAVDGLSIQSFGPEIKSISGKGLPQLGKVIGNSRGLYNCMVRKMVAQVYLGKVFGLKVLDEADMHLLDSQKSVIDRIASEFHQHQNLRQAYEAVALHYLEAIEE